MGQGAAATRRKTVRRTNNAVREANKAVHKAKASSLLAGALSLPRQLLGVVPAGLAVCDKEGRVVEANERMADLWGAAAARGEAWPTFCARNGWDGPAETLPLVEALRTGHAVTGRELDIVRPDGRRLTILSNAELLRDRRGRLVGAVVCHHDISAMKRAHAESEERDRHYRQLLDALPVAIYTTDVAGRITFYNKAAAELAGRTPTLGSDEWCVTWRLFHADGRPLPHDECPMAIALRENRAVRGVEAIAERPDGTRVPFVAYPTPLRDATGALVGAVNLLIDISAPQAAERERQRLVAELTALNATLEQRVGERTRALINEGDERRSVEAQLHQLQKTEALGHLTGGIAHDFNNLLTAVIGNLDMIDMRSRDEGVRHHARAAARAAQRGATLTRQLLAFSRKQRLDPKSTHINELVGGISEMLARTIGGTVRIELALSRDLWPALVDPNQIESALLNLAINARDAMPGGGTVTIATANIEVGPKCRIDRLDPGDYVMLAVRDTGIGMSEDVKAKAFDPFFTTKEVGKGSGLGLSQVYGIARQSGGTATIESTPGHGTVVRLYLPRAATKSAERAIEAGSAEPDVAATARILVVDDDEDVREVLLASLYQFGHRAEGARSAAEAFAALERGSYDLVVLDFAMPEMNGAAAAERLRERWPHLPILHVSGYPARPELGSDHVVLQKPFVAAELGAKVEQLLERSGKGRRSNVVLLRQSGAGD